MLQITNLHKSYNRNSVIKGINLAIGRGALTAILGPNGSGKTTIIKSILGMVIPDQGEILFEGKPIKGSWQYRESINYLPQIARFPENLKVKELINLVKELRQKEANELEIIERFQLEDDMNKALRNLSGGTRQKVNLVLAFMFNNPMIILDEPSSGLDPVAIIQLKELIAKEVKEGKTILFTTHIMSLVEELAEEIVFILEGKVYFKGSQNKLMEMTEEENLEHSIASILSSNGVEGEEVLLSSNND